MSDKRQIGEFDLPPSDARMQQDLDEELALHMKLRVEEYCARGMSAESARELASRRFGDLDEARAYCREEDSRRLQRVRRVRWVEEVMQDVRISMRQLRRSRAFAVAAVLTMAIGIGMATVSYAIVHAYLVRALPYPEADRLASVIAAPTREPFPDAPSLDAVDWRATDSLFPGTVSWDLDGFTLVGDDAPEFVDGAWVSAGYFRSLGFRPALGRAFLPSEFENGADVALISDGLWSRRFNRDPSIVGRSIRAYSTDRPRDSELVTIVGVMPSDAWHISRFTDVLRPLPQGRMPYILKLPEGMAIADAEARLNAVVKPQLPSANPAWRMSLVSLQQEFTYQVRPTLLALMAGSLFMLLIGSASVAGALTARAAARRREFDLRSALGASRWRITRQLLAESAVLTLLAAAVGFIIEQVALAAFGADIGKGLGVPVPDATGRVEPGALVVAIAIVVGAATTYAFNLLPSLFGARAAGGKSLVGTDRGAAGGIRATLIRRGLVSAQIALTMLLLVGAGLMVRTVLALNDKPLGFSPSGVLKANLLLPLSHYPDSTARVRAIADVLEATRSVAGVRGAAIVGPHPFRGNAEVTVFTEGGHGGVNRGPQAAAFVVAGAYFDVMSIPMRRGRRFEDRDAAHTEPVAIISARLAAQLWPTSEAIGRRVRFSETGRWRTVVGIAADTRKPLGAQQLPDVYFPFAQAPRAFVSILTRSDVDPASVASPLARRLAALSPVLALSSAEPMIALVERDEAQPRMIATTLAIFAIFAIFALSLAVLGLYSSLSYVVAQRTRELAVRVAIGAGRGAIIRLVLGEGIRTVAAGLLIGTAFSLALSRTLASQLYGVTPTDPTTFAAIVAILALTALVAIVSPAWRATRVDPCVALRGE